MNDRHDAPILVLLTREEVGARLNLAPRLVDGLIKTGDLKPVLVSGGSDRRFWPDEVIACALRASINEDAAADARRLAGTLPAAGAEAAAGMPSAAGADPVARKRIGRPARHPAWPPFTGPIERHIQSYIAFADRDHLVNYLRRRALVELA